MRLHPWHIRSLWFILIFTLLFPLGFIFPWFRDTLWECLAIEMLIYGVMGLIGPMIFFWRNRKNIPWRNVNGIALQHTIYLTPELYIDEDGEG